MLAALALAVPARGIRVPATLPSRQRTTVAVGDDDEPQTRLRGGRSDIVDGAAAVGSGGVDVHDHASVVRGLFQLGAPGGIGRNVTFPARQYAVNGERRSFALLRPIVDTAAQEKVREPVLEAYQEYEERSSWGRADAMCRCKLGLLRAALVRIICPNRNLLQSWRGQDNCVHCGRPLPNRTIPARPS